MKKLIFFLTLLVACSAYAGTRSEGRYHLTVTNAVQYIPFSENGYLTVVNLASNTNVVYASFGNHILTTNLNLAFPIEPGDTYTSFDKYSGIGLYSPSTNGVVINVGKE